MPNRLTRQLKIGRFDLLIFFSFFWSCHSKTETDPIVPVPVLKLEFTRPAHFPQPVYDFSANPVTDEGAALGRALFNEGLLSSNKLISCASCHVQGAVFTHPAHPLSHGVDDRFTLRNAQPVMNLAWNRSFMWDGSVTHLDSFSLFPLQHPNEMDETPANAVAKLQAHATYPARFKKVFGTDQIEIGHVLKALSQFMLVCTSANSRYDRFMTGKGEVLNAEELAGMQVFEAKCSSCHSGVLFTDFSFRQNGLPIKNRSDSGRYRHTNALEDLYKFRVPSLRNVEHSKPYMHDGRFSSLESVVEFYRSGMVQRSNTDPVLLQGATPGIAITDAEKKQLVAFLKTLTDLEFLTRPELYK